MRFQLQESFYPGRGRRTEDSFFRLPACSLGVLSSAFLSAGIVIRGLYRPSTTSPPMYGIRRPSSRFFRFERDLPIRPNTEGLKSLPSRRRPIRTSNRSFCPSPLIKPLTWLTGRRGRWDGGSSIEIWRKDESRQPRQRSGSASRTTS